VSSDHVTARGELDDPGEARPPDRPAPVDHDGGGADPPELVDWELAGRIGRRVAGGPELPVRESWGRQFTELSTRADLAVAEFTGLGGDLPPPVAAPLDRGEWVEANLRTLARMLQPVRDKVARRRSWTAPGRMPALARQGTQAVAGVQAGALLGYVAQRVLGQYDLPVPDPTVAEPEGTVFYVVPNIVGVERRNEFNPRDFRLWVALHECAHRRQFRGVPWLSGHVQGMLDEFLATVDLDEEAVRRVAKRGQALVGKVLAGEPVELMDFLISPQAKQVVDRMQATMSVLEGHGEFVMQRLGAELVPGHERMHSVLHDRRLAPSAGDRVIQQVLGLRRKLDQYTLGERFITALHEHGGMETVNRLFEEPAQMPSLAELHEPDRWLARVVG
jgi:coenzyme F420 biosynthesis associated uncharacterized protein